MALIKCIDCKKKFSSEAPACPFCGCPTEKVIAATPTDKLGDAITPSLGLKFDFYRGKQYLMSMGQCKDKVLRIPSEYDQKKVSAIASKAFAYATIEQVYIPKTIKVIESCAFESCYKLKEIYYDGSKSKWGAIRRDRTWCINTIVDVICKDGVLHY